jgi:hypothetical protein
MKQTKKSDHKFLVYFFLFVFLLIIYSPRLFSIYKYGIVGHMNRRRERRQDRMQYIIKQINN